MNILVLLTAMYYLSMPCHSKHVPLSPSDSASDAPTAVIVEAVAVAVAVAVMTASAAVTTEHIPLFYPPSAPFWSCSMPSGGKFGDALLIPIPLFILLCTAECSRTRQHLVQREQNPGGVALYEVALTNHYHRRHPFTS